MKPYYDASWLENSLQISLFLSLKNENVLQLPFVISYPNYDLMRIIAYAQVHTVVICITLEN